MQASPKCKKTILFCLNIGVSFIDLRLHVWYLLTDIQVVLTLLVILSISILVGHFAIQVG